MPALQQEFERIRPTLLQEGRKCDREGAYARGMLALVPAFIAHMRREQAHAAIDAHDVLDGMANVLSNLAYHTIIETVSEPAQRPHAFAAMLRHIDKGVAPMLRRTAGGVIVPNGIKVL